MRLENRVQTRVDRHAEGLPVDLLLVEYMGVSPQPLSPCGWMTSFGGLLKTWDAHMARSIKCEAMVLS
jgi:hypothetical protein